MNTIKKIIVVAVALGAFGLSNNASAQDANRDEVKRQLDRLREQLDVKDADEWTIISERLAKVIEIRAAGGGGRGGFQGRGGGGGRGRGQGDRDRDRGDRDNRERDGRERGQDNRGDRPQGDRDRAQNDRDRPQGDRDRDRGRGGRGGDRGGDRGANIDPNSPQGKLRAALESNASSSELAGLLKTYRAAREANSAKLAEARAALREVVTTRQEVILVMNRLLD